MPVAPEGYSAGAWVRGHLHRVIQACSTSTPYFGLDLYHIGSLMDFNSFVHRVRYELRSLLPVPLLAGALHTKEKTPRIIAGVVKRSAAQQIFHCAIAKQSVDIAVHVPVRRHANRP